MINIVFDVTPRKLYILISVYYRQQIRYTFFLPSQQPLWARPPHYRGSVITERHTTLGRNPLDEWAARRRDLYLAKHNTYKRQISVPRAGFEPAIPANERPQTYALDWIRDTKSTKCTVMFLRYLHYSITLNILTRFDPQGTIIRELNKTNMA